MDPYLYVIPWTGAAVIIGYIGKNTRTGFWLTFLASMLFSPLAGIIVALLSPPKKQHDEPSPNN